MAFLSCNSGLDRTLQRFGLEPLNLQADERRNKVTEVACSWGGSEFPAKPEPSGPAPRLQLSRGYSSARERLHPTRCRTLQRIHCACIAQPSAPQSTCISVLSAILNSGSAASRHSAAVTDLYQWSAFQRYFDQH